MTSVRSIKEIDFQVLLLRWLSAASRATWLLTIMLRLDPETPITCCCRMMLAASHSPWVAVLVAHLDRYWRGSALKREEAGGTYARTTRTPYGHGSMLGGTPASPESLAPCRDAPWRLDREGHFDARSRFGAAGHAVSTLGFASVTAEDDVAPERMLAVVISEVAPNCCFSPHRAGNRAVDDLTQLHKVLGSFGEFEEYQMLSAFGLRRGAYGCSARGHDVVIDIDVSGVLAIRRSTFL
jgi:hypothetical protein